MNFIIHMTSDNRTKKMTSERLPVRQRVRINRTVLGHVSVPVTPVGYEYSTRSRIRARANFNFKRLDVRVNGMSRDTSTGKVRARRSGTLSIAYL